MFEDSVETFIVRWRPFTTDVRVFGRVEGSPLLEVDVAGTILQVLERTGPYRAHPGKARMILNFTADRLEVANAGRKQIEVSGISKARVTGVVLLREENMVVVDGGVPVVVGVHEPLDDHVAAGDVVAFEGLPPIHGFLVPFSAKASGPAGSNDDLM